MRLFTIGFTKWSAEAFFSRLQRAGVRRLIDVRLNNVSQLAGFAKRDDLRYFAKTICSIDYRHALELAPTQEMLDAYRKHACGWSEYERRFLSLIGHRRIENTDQDSLNDSCLLCSEHQPHQCHRRVVAEYLQSRWRGVDIVHLC
jgi:uncharacterized protein (DUF488 family)